MKDDAQTVLKWDYTPPDFFEESIQIDVETGRITLEKGLARGTFAASEYARGAEFWDEMHERLRQEFTSQQVLVHKTFTLPKPKMTREHTDGRIDQMIFGTTFKSKIQVYSSDITIRDAEGNVIQDSRAERLEERRDFREKVARFVPNHPELAQMLESFRMSVEDEQNCFLHLHEITDALTKVFGNQSTAKSTLGKIPWNTLGKLANSDANTASRHRGKLAPLVPVSDTQLDEGRFCAQQLIQAYVEHLELS